jgi:iron complex transport system substrate-binding protein
MRIVSLLPSATEVLFALGLGDSVVGVTHECDFPAEAAGKPVLVKPRVDSSADAAEIDAQVREILAAGEALYSVDAELLRSLEPDLIITQDLCHVCAAGPGDLADALTRFEKIPRVLSLLPHTLADVWDDVQKIGGTAGRIAEANRLASDLKSRVARVEERTTERRIAAQRLAEQGIGAQGAPDERAADQDAVAQTPALGAVPGVLCLEWLDPPYVAGHWTPQMVARAGGRDVLGIPGEPSFRVPWRRIVEAPIDVILVMPCGCSVARAADEFRKLVLPPGWERIPAVKAGRVFAVDSNSYFSRPGPRLADGVEFLADLLNFVSPENAPPPNFARRIVR